MSFKMKLDLCKTDTNASVNTWNTNGFPQVWILESNFGGKKSLVFLVIQLSISPTFYKQLYLTNVFCKVFLQLQFGFVVFWQKKSGAKAACKMLMKLTKGVNFINILFSPFSYESILRCFSLITVWFCDFWHQCKSCL